MSQIFIVSIEDMIFNYEVSFNNAERTLLKQFSNQMNQPESKHYYIDSDGENYKLISNDKFSPTTYDRVVLTGKIQEASP